MIRIHLSTLLIMTIIATTLQNARGEENLQKKQILEPFALGQVVLNPDSEGRPTPFMKHRDKFLEGLAKSNPDDFLYNFREAFGQSQPDGAKQLGVWEDQTCKLRGHASGHYLSAIAQAYASTTYDPELHTLFKKRMDYLIDTLYDLSQKSGKPVKPGKPHTSDPTKTPPGPGKDSYDSDLSKDGIRTDYWNWGEGFISAYPPDQFIMLEQGASYGTGNDQVWAPYYTLHKILAGLMDCYELGGNPKALEVAKGMGQWVSKRLGALPEETCNKMWNSYIAGEYGGMNEALGRLSRLTGDKRFLECARMFDNPAFFGDAEHPGLDDHIDTLGSRHANQHIPQITGALEIYKDTHDPYYARVAENFWDICTHGYMYSIGGVAGSQKNPECFISEGGTLFHNGFNKNGQNETCATYNLLKLGRRLFMYDPAAQYMDYYERALYNDLLASVAEHDAGNTYHIPLNPGAVKDFSNANMDGFTCCNGTALESATKLQNTIYLKAADDSALYVNLYIPSTLTWKECDIKITQETSYPYSDTVKLTINGSGRFALNLRIPNWADNDVELRFNGKTAKIDTKPGSYLKLNHKWKDGDTIELKLPMNFHLMPLTDQPNIASIFYGPVLLAAQETEALDDWRKIELDPENIGASFKGDPSRLRFESNAIRFKPFFETYGHHSVYLNILPKRATASNDPPIQAVDDRALLAAYDRLPLLLAHLPDARKKLSEAGAELHIIGRNGVTTDLPESRDMKGVKILEYGGQTYDERTRGLGGKQPLSKGLWAGSYAGSNVEEFFAEPAMWYIGTHGDVRMKGPAPAAGPEGLKTYGPEAYQLVDSFWSGRFTK